MRYFTFFEVHLKFSVYFILTVHLDSDVNISLEIFD